MKMKKARPLKLVLLANIFTLFLLYAPAWAADVKPDVKLLPSPMDRGTAARVLVEGLPENSGLAGTFDGRPVMFFPISGKMAALVPADVMLSPGRYPLKLSWKGGSRTVEVTVRDKAYGVRSITVPDKQVNLSKADQDRAARERKLVVAALNTKSPQRLWTGPWQEPVGGKVNSSFGRQTRINGVLNPRPHAGADYSVPEGTPVKALADGVVILADDHFYAGKSVYIDHGLGVISMYFHLSKIKAAAGDSIKRGQVLGLSGKTGRVTGAHLHYGIYICQARIDPVAFQRLTVLLPKED